MSATEIKRVLLVGWDGADWQVINPLLDAGRMPNLERIVTTGVMGNLASLFPQLSPMLWTSIATGKRPFQHGVLGFTEPNPHGAGIRPVTSLSRRTRAIWNMLHQTGRTCAVVGWWPSHPAEPIRGVMVSNHYQRAVVPYGQPWPMAPRTIHPRRLIRNLRELRVHPQELDTRLILDFVPRLAEIDQEKDRRIESLAKIVADCTTVANAAAAILHHEPWDFAAVYFDALDHFSHGFMKFHPPRQEWVPQRDFELYQHVVAGGYIYHDVLLGRLLAETDESTAVMLVSDHGFHSDHLRPRHLPNEPAGPAAQHRTHGIFAVSGPGLRRDERLYGANLLDICPTILTLFGLPVGEDMDGKPLVNISLAPPAVETIPSWDEIPGPDGSHPAGLHVDPVEARAALQQLVALGYIAPPPANAEAAAAETVRELRYNLARAYVDANRHADAVPVLDELAAAWPDEYRFGILLITCLQTLGRMERTRPLLQELVRRRRRNRQEAIGKLREFRAKHPIRNRRELSGPEWKELRQLRSRLARNPAAMEYLLACQLLAEGKEEAALRRLRQAARHEPRNPSLHLKAGDVFLKLKRWPDAEEAFRKSLEIDPENAAAHLGLCRSLLPRRLNRAAALAALDSIGLLYHNPMGHYLLGMALHRMGHIPRAVEALSVAVAQNPNFPEAYERLAAIHERRLHDPGRAAEFQTQAEEARRRIMGIKAGTTIPSIPETAGRAWTSGMAAPACPEAFATGGEPVDPAKIIVIVAGLPRSGTSMMMQMLRAGGLPILTDGRREADDDNPRGYFEFEPATRLHQDSSWLPQAHGRAVKIVAHLLRYLPLGPEFHYRVILMERGLAEVLASQREALARQRKSVAAISEARLGEVFSVQVRIAQRQLAEANVPMLFVDYARTVADPAATAVRLNAFLGGTLDEGAMAAAVESGLYRQRMETDPV